jgi:L-fuconolactonase
MGDPQGAARAWKVPETTIILNHVGGVLGVGPYAGRRQEILTSWREDIKEIAKCPNVYRKLGGIGMVSFGFDFHERDNPFIRRSRGSVAAVYRTVY